LAALRAGGLTPGRQRQNPPRTTHTGTARMDLTPRERDQLLVFTAALLAERRRARGLRLNLPEAQALIAAAVFEGAREGKGVEQVAAEAGRLLVRADVMDGVAENLGEIRVEATFTDGLRLVTLQRPIA